MRRRTKWLLGGLGGALLAVGTGFQLMPLGYEEPAYEVVAEHGPLEVRRYAPRVVAQTVVSGAEGDVTGEGFRRLAGYIFGGNAGEQEVAMTTPVERAPTKGRRIAMTTPVERAPAEDGATITFTMPSEHDLASLPTPNDPRVELRELPAETVAVLRFRGRATDASRDLHTRALEALLERHGYDALGAPSLAQYDPPWVLGPFRRNEIHVPVTPRDGA